MTLRQYWNNSGNIFIFTLKKNLPLILIATAIAVFNYPITYLASMKEHGISSVLGEHVSYGFVPTMVGLWAIILILAIVLSINNLKYLHSKKASDMFMSLPTSRGALLFARTAATAFGSVIPIFASCITTLLITVPFGVKPEFIVYLISVCFILAIINVALVFIGSLFMTITGKTFEAGITFFATVFGLPLLVIMITSFVDKYLYGFAIGLDLNSLTYIISPVLVFFLYGSNAIATLPLLGREYNESYSFTYYLEHEFTTAYLTEAIVWAILAVICLAVAMILVKRRKTETAGSAFSYKFLPIAVQASVSIIAAYYVALIFGGYTMQIEASFILYAFFGGTIASVVLGAIIDRGFKKTLKNLIVGIVCCSLIMGIGLAIKYDIFGFVSYVPKTEDIKEVTVLHSSYDSYLTDYNVSSTYKKQEDFENVTLMHKDIISHKNDDAMNCFDPIIIQYTLKNGSVVFRKYNRFNLTDNSARLKLIKNESFYNNYTFISKNTDYIYLNNTVYDYDSDYTGGVYRVTYSDAEKLMAAFVEDLRDGANLKNRGGATYLIKFGDPGTYLSDSNINRFTLYDSNKKLMQYPNIQINKYFVNTLNCLEEIGVPNEELAALR